MAKKGYSREQFKKDILSFLCSHKETVIETKPVVINQSKDGFDSTEAMLRTMSCKKCGKVMAEEYL